MKLKIIISVVIVVLGVGLFYLKGLYGSTQFSVSIMTDFIQEPAVEFEGEIILLKAGSELIVPFKGKSNISIAYRADKFVSCTVRRTHGEGWLQVLVHEKGKLLFESPEHNSNEPYTYTHI